jgi:hypothetical protein
VGLGNQQAAVYYRAWDGGERFEFGTLPVDGTVEAVLSRARTPLEVLVTQPGQVPKPLAFNSEKKAQQRTPQVRLKLTVDGASDEFWLTGTSAHPYVAQAYPNQRRVVHSPSRRATITMPQDVIELGFDVRLRWFVRKLDPGTEMDAGYTSLVDFLPRGEAGADGQAEPIAENVEIVLNKPIDVVDPDTGRGYRMFQSS